MVDAEKSKTPLTETEETAQTQEGGDTTLNEKKVKDLQPDTERTESTLEPEPDKVESSSEPEPDKVESSSEPEP